MWHHKLDQMAPNSINMINSHQNVLHHRDLEPSFTQLLSSYCLKFSTMSLPETHRVQKFLLTQGGNCPRNLQCILPEGCKCLSHRVRIQASIWKCTYIMPVNDSPDKMDIIGQFTCVFWFTRIFLRHVRLARWYGDFTTWKHEWKVYGWQVYDRQVHDRFDAHQAGQMVLTLCQLSFIPAIPAD